MEPNTLIPRRHNVAGFSTRKVPDGTEYAKQIINFPKGKSRATVAFRRRHFGWNRLFWSVEIGWALATALEQITLQKNTKRTKLENGNEEVFAGYGWVG